MAEECEHTRLHEVSVATLRWTWDRQEDGTYEPDTEPKFLGEDSQWFECVDCGVRVSLDVSARLDDISDD